MKSTKVVITLTQEDYDTKDLQSMIRSAVEKAGCFVVESVEVSYDYAEIRNVNPSGRAPFRWHVSR